MKTTPLLLLCAVTAVLTSPLKGGENDTTVNRVLYDQRQEGEWNVQADLKNIVFLIIPTQSSTPSNLLDFLLRAVPKRGQKLHQRKVAPGEETQHFIESKTAPYHVDISRSRNQLAKLHPEPPVVNAEEIVIAKSPAISLVKEESNARAARAFVLTVPSEEGYAEMKKKKEGKKNPKEAPKSVLKLLGAENEQCGPGLVRDAEGVCRTTQN